MAKIIGNTTATPNPRPDWSQTDETKADYIKNKPTVDLVYSAESENAQSGKAVAAALEQFVPTIDESQLVGEKQENNAEIFNDYENNQAIASYSSASGTNSTAGWMGYPVLMSEYHPSDPEMKNIIVILGDKDTDENGNPNKFSGNRAIDKFALGDVVNLDHQSHTYDKFTITHIMTAEEYDDNTDISENLTMNWGIDLKYVGHTVLVLVAYDANGNLTQISESSFKLSSTPEDNWLWCIDKLAGIPITAQIAPMALGSENIAAGNGAFSAGRQNKSNGDYSATVGRSNRAGYASFAAGRSNNGMGMYSFTAGSGNTTKGTYSVSLGEKTKSIGQSSFAMGKNTTANANCSVAFGMGTITGIDAYGAAAFGLSSEANGAASLAAGEKAIANGKNSVALGYYSTANGDFSLAAGYKSNANGKFSVAFGTTTADGSYAVAIGNGAIASGTMSFAHGSSTASGVQSAAFGGGSASEGQYSFAGGYKSKAIGKASFAFGSGCNANFDQSIACGNYVSTKAKYQAVFGKFSKMTDQMLFGIGDGTGNPDDDYANEYRNAFSVFADGHAELRTQGATDNSVVLNKTFNEYKNTLSDKVESKKFVSPKDSSGLYLTTTIKCEEILYDENGNAIYPDPFYTQESIRLDGSYVQYVGNYISLHPVRRDYTWFHLEDWDYAEIYDIRSYYANIDTIVSKNGVTQTSARDAKENIKNVMSASAPAAWGLRNPVEASDITTEDVIDFVRNLQPVTFNYKGSEAQESEQLGLIADDIAEHPVYKYIGIDRMETIETKAEYDEEGNIVKEATSEEKRILGLQALPLATVALSTCQELLNKIEILEARIEELEG